MIEYQGNYAKLRTSNISKFHSLGYKGEGVKVGIIESNLEDVDHVNDVVEVFKMVAPRAEVKVFGIGTFKDNHKYFKEVYDDGYNLLNYSVIGPNLKSSIYYPQVARRVFMVCSSGNSGKEQHFEPASHEETLSVGATYNGKVIANFSTYNDKIDVVNFTGITLKDGSYVSGTSISAPYTTGMIALYMQMFKKKFGRFPHINETTHYVRNNCIDLYEPGKDNKSGHGLFILSEDVYDMILDSRKNELRKVSDWKREVEKEVNI